MTKKKKPIATGYVPYPSDDGITAVSVEGGWDPEKQTIGILVKLHRIEAEEKSTTHILKPSDDLPEKTENND